MKHDRCSLLVLAVLGCTAAARPAVSANVADAWLCASEAALAWRRAVVGVTWNRGVQGVMDERAKAERASEKPVAYADDYSARYAEALKSGRKLVVRIGQSPGLREEDCAGAITCVIPDTPGQRHLWKVSGPATIIGVPRDGKLWVEKRILYGQSAPLELWIEKRILYGQSAPLGLGSPACTGGA